jgi:hypothetical protein
VQDWIKFTQIEGDVSVLATPPNDDSLVTDVILFLTLRVRLASYPEVVMDMPIYVWVKYADCDCSAVSFTP